MSIATWEFESPPLHSAKGNLLKRRFPQIAEIAQLVEHNLAKVGVASSSLVFRSNYPSRATEDVCSAYFLVYGLLEWWNGRHEGLKIPWAETPVRVRVPLRAPANVADCRKMVCDFSL